MNVCQVGFGGGREIVSRELNPDPTKIRNKKLMLFNGRIKKHDKHNMLFGDL